MVDVAKLQEEIIAHPEHIKEILEILNFDSIQDKGRYYSFANHGGDNLSACSILKSTLQYQNFSHGGSGNIITLVQSEKGCTFPKALEYISKWIGFKGEEYTKKKIVKPFGGFYSSITSDTNDGFEIQTYNEDILPPAECLSYLWLKDGVDLKTQERFGIRLDLNSDKIIIPARTLDGSLVGAKFRINSRSVSHDQRWGMYKPYSKSKIIWGANNNYYDITRKRVVFVVEAEKSVAQLSSIGYNLGVAIGGHNISPVQARQIRALFPDKIVVAFDSDVCFEEAEYEAKKLISNSNIMYSPKVGVIHDDTNLILDSNKKLSPTDMGYNVFKILSTKCVKWLN